MKEGKVAYFLLFLIRAPQLNLGNDYYLKLENLVPYDVFLQKGRKGGRRHDCIPLSHPGLLTLRTANGEGPYQSLPGPSTLNSIGRAASPLVETRPREQENDLIKFPKPHSLNSLQGYRQQYLLSPP